MIHVKRNVEFTQAYGCWLCLHIGTTAIYFGRRNGYGLRLEIATPLELFRVA